MFLVNIQSEPYLLPGLCFSFYHFKGYRCIIFPERQEFKDTLTKLFRTFKKIRASVDCTVFKCEMLRNYSQQEIFYLSYKRHCTMKCLIAVNPNGVTCFISDLFEGSITYLDIFDKYGILQQINPALLVDKVFTIQHLFLPKQATIFIPLSWGSTFTK